MQRTDQQIWELVIERANLGEEAGYLSYTHHELKRSTLFLRKLQEVEIPVEVVSKLRLAAASLDLRLRLTDKWATMEDLQYAVGDVNWLWKDWIPKEMITLLAGEPGTGKSQLALWFCKVVAEGLAFPDGVRAEPGKVIFVDAEAAQVITKERCINMEIPLDRVYVPNLGNDMLAQPDLNEESHRDQLWNMVQDIEPSLIVIDSMGGIKSGGENRKEEMQPIMLYLTRLVQNRNSAIMVLHHLNKTKREEDEEIALNHLRGSSVIAQFARSVVFISRKPIGTKLWVGKSNIAKLGDPLKVLADIELVEGQSIIRGFDFAPWSEEQKTTKIEECQRWVTMYLANQPDFMAISRQIFEAGDEMWTTRTVKEAGSILERKRLITRSGGKNSIWKLTQLPLREDVGTDNGNLQVERMEERTD